MCVSLSLCLCMGDCKNLFSVSQKGQKRRRGPEKSCVIKSCRTLVTSASVCQWCGITSTRVPSSQWCDTISTRVPRHCRHDGTSTPHCLDITLDQLQHRGVTSTPHCCHVNMAPKALHHDGITPTPLCPRNGHRPRRAFQEM